MYAVLDANFETNSKRCEDQSEMRDEDTEKITLEHNQLKALPASVGGAKALVSLNLNNNHLGAQGVRVASKALLGCTALGARLRLDANQAWSREQAVAGREPSIAR